MKLISKANLTFDQIIGIFIFLTCLLIIAIMLGITIEVTIRYVWGYMIEGIIEVTEYALLWLTFLGAAWVLKKEGHVKMDLLLSQLPPGTQAMVNVITSIIGAIICLALAWYGFQLTLKYFLMSYYKASLLEIPTAFIQVVVPIGSFLLVIQFLRRTHGYWRDWKAS